VVNKPKWTSTACIVLSYLVVVLLLVLIFGLEVMPAMTNTLDELLVLCTIIYLDRLVICGHLST
jgi:hypothetical protein